jgi:hypothetical protein
MAWIMILIAILDLTGFVRCRPLMKRHYPGGTHRGRLAAVRPVRPRSAHVWPSSPAQATTLWVGQPADRHAADRRGSAAVAYLFSAAEETAWTAHAPLTMRTAASDLSRCRQR